jgi:two-component system NtrC family sensor kinase
VTRKHIPTHDRGARATAKAAATNEPGGPADHETSSARARIPNAIPHGWLDRLLSAVVDLPLLDGEPAVVEAAVDAVAGIIPGHAVGACFVRELRSGLREQLVVKRLPEGETEVQSDVDPARLFPGFDREYVTAIPDGPPGSTFHIASNDDSVDGDSAPAHHLVDRAAAALGRALTQTRAIAALDSRHPDAHALERRMLQADKLANFGQIAAGIVHELNNPLTSIVAYTDYLIRKAGADGSIGEAEDVGRLKRISESATRMLGFARDLISYARPSNGARGPIVLHDAIDQAVAFCEHVLSEAGVRVERRYGADVLTVHAAGEQLVQVFVNLFTNASQAAPLQGGHVVVSTALVTPSRGARRVKIIVEDNGSGIAAEHLPLVFVPFFTTKRDSQGTGLGLAIVKSVLENHGGDIYVESDLGLSTRFVIDLPTTR